MAMKKVKLNICGSAYTLSVDDDPAYYEELGEKLDTHMRTLMEANEKISVTTAAVLSALDYLDELGRSNHGADNLRSQLKAYLEDAQRAKNMAENASQELDAMKLQLEHSRSECERLRHEIGYMKGQDN